MGQQSKLQSDPEKARLFVGVEISMATVGDLIELVESMQPTARAAGVDLRWLPPATYHVTLKFLGWAPREVIPAVRDSVAAALQGIKAFDVSTYGVGAFPKPEHARVLWAGFKRGADELSALAKKIDLATAGIGFESEARPFHPHVTLARLKTPRPIQQILLPFSDQSCRPSRIERVVLFESLIKSEGSQYEKLASWPLESV